MYNIPYLNKLFMTYKINKMGSSLLFNSVTTCGVFEGTKADWQMQCHKLLRLTEF